MSVLRTTALSIGYINKGQSAIVQTDLNLQLAQGELLCLIGPNGSGKSTLLRTLTALQAPLSGNVYIHGKDVQKIAMKERAQLISLVLTDRVEIEHATVYDLVAMGRHPHSGWLGKISEKDQDLVTQALDRMHLHEMKHRPFAQLSDGEKQRAMIAKAFVQDTPIMILDEPTAHLDLPNRIEIMLLLHQMAHETNKTILLSTHELDMALQAADRVWLMSKYQGVAVGVPEDLVLNGKFHDAFQSEHYVFNPANGNFSMNYMADKKVSVQGDKTRMYWTLRALARAGYRAEEKTNPLIIIEDNCWRIGQNQYNSIEELLDGLAHAVHHAD